MNVILHIHSNVNVIYHPIIWFFIILYMRGLPPAPPSPHMNPTRQQFSYPQSTFIHSFIGWLVKSKKSKLLVQPKFCFQFFPLGCWSEVYSVVPFDHTKMETIWYTFVCCSTVTKLTVTSLCNPLSVSIKINWSIIITYTLYVTFSNFLLYTYFYLCNQFHVFNMWLNCWTCFD